MANSQLLLFIQLFLLCQLPTRPQTCFQIAFHWKDGLKDRVLNETNKIREITVKQEAECFFNCYQNCHCLSFNVCGTKCELNAANSFSTSVSIIKKEGCRYYDQPLDEVKK